MIGLKSSLLSTKETISLLQADETSLYYSTETKRKGSLIISHVRTDTPIVAETIHVCNYISICEISYHTGFSLKVFEKTRWSLQESVFEASCAPLGCSVG
jgi:hypothetical protein